MNTATRARCYRARVCRNRTGRRLMSGDRAFPETPVVLRPPTTTRPHH